MCLIFDRFPSMDKAEQFVAVVNQQHELGAWTWATRNAMEGDEKHPGWDVFPFGLDAPIVTVERPGDGDTEALERKVEALVTDFGGTFAGT